MNNDPKTLIRLIPVALLLVAALLLLPRLISPRRDREDELSGSSAPLYAGSNTCAPCHSEIHRIWSGSHHALAEVVFDEAAGQSFRSPEASLPESEQSGDQQRVIKHDGQTTFLRERAGKYEIITRSGDGKMSTFEPVRVIGVYPLWQNVIAAPRGRYQVTALAFDPENNEWFDANRSQSWQPHEWGFWANRGMTWNSMCAACHTTNLRKNYDSQLDSYDTTYLELGVGCEACHGPSLGHVRDMQQRGERARNPPRKPDTWDPAKFLEAAPESWPEGEDLYESVIDRMNEDAARPDDLTDYPAIQRDTVVDICGSCHARRSELSENFLPGDSFDDHYRLEIPDETELFYPDGQILDEDYEYTSFLSSRMYLIGIRCLHCHDPHSGKIKAKGNDLCLNCHKEKIDPAEHSHHDVTGEGGKCANCHMPRTTYMERHPRRDHGFTIPDPLLTKEHGIPNACNRCHTDKSTDWAIEATRAWYGDKMNRSTRTRARTIARARGGDVTAIDGLLEIAREDSSPLWRAVATHLLGPWATLREDVGLHLISSLGSSSALVRTRAAQALEVLVSLGMRLPALESLLEDPMRSVRIAAAWSLRSVPAVNARQLAGSGYSSYLLDAHADARMDLDDYLDLISDQPSGLLMKGQFLLERGRSREAITCFERAVTWNPTAAGYHDTLAVAFSTVGQREKALQSMRKAAELEPENSELRYRLALVLLDSGKTEEAAGELETACRLQPLVDRYWHELAQALIELERYQDALNPAMRADELSPGDPRYMRTRASVHRALGQQELAEDLEKRAGERIEELKRR